MEKALPSDVVVLLRTAGHLAEGDKLGAAEGVYLVGGPVRDLLLGVESEDIDITVIGDGEAFGQALAKELGGTVAARSQFGTVVLRVGDPLVDVATARRESYSSPGALPDVEPDGLEADLARRDFTINSMAVDITPSGWGELIDSHGGQRDLTMRRIRVLHEKSFVDDPTRILRALRYERRLGFGIDPTTLSYMERDAQYLDYVTGTRIFAELSKILAEDGRAETLRTAEERGILAAIHPAFRISARALQAMGESEKAGEERDALFYVALIAASLVESEAEAVIDRLEPPSEWASVLRAGPQLRPVVAVLERPDLRLSEIYDVLKPFPAPTLSAQLALSPPTLQRERLEQYMTELRFVKPECGGDDLMAAGVPQGPLVGQLLDELLNARLDRTTRSKEDELELVRRRLPLMLGHAEAEG